MIKYGTYRIVKYADDGQYDIHWTCCDSHMQSCEWQAERFRFCPFCGAGHASKLKCRKSNIARWAYDLHPDNECEAEQASYDARVKAHNLEKNQTRWVIERKHGWHIPRWKAINQATFLHASDALAHADHYFSAEVQEEYSFTKPIVLRLRLVTGELKQDSSSPKVLESPRWVHDLVGDYAKEHGISREEAKDKLEREQFEVMMNLLEDEE